MPLIPPGYEFMDRFNQFDMKFAKLFRVNGVRLTGQFEIFNALELERGERSAKRHGYDGLVEYRRPGTASDRRGCGRHVLWDAELPSAGRHPSGEAVQVRHAD